MRSRVDVLDQRSHPRLYSILLYISDSFYAEVMIEDRVVRADAFYQTSVDKFLNTSLALDEDGVPLFSGERSQRHYARQNDVAEILVELASGLLLLDR